MIRNMSLDTFYKAQDAFKGGGAECAGVNAEDDVVNMVNELR